MYNFYNNNCFLEDEDYLPYSHLINEIGASLEGAPQTPKLNINFP